jgi:phosphonate transport system permease protein
MTTSPPAPLAPARADRIRALHAARPRSRFVRASLWAFLGLLVASFVLADIDWHLGDPQRRAQNLERFARDIRPKPIRDTAFDLGEVVAWAGERMGEGGGWRATSSTLAISVLAIVLAGLAGAVLALFAARNLMAPAPFGATAYRPGPLRRLASRVVVTGTRVVLVLLRCLPEYLLAFLFLAVFGYTAWPAVLALAVHNAGILGRLDAEAIENVDARSARALRDLGATRLGIATAAVFPAVLPRGLLYLFYRWETCVREATVLGLLNIPSLGLLIDDAQVRGRKDELLFYVLVASFLVIAGDLLSSWLRHRVREASARARA